MWVKADITRSWLRLVALGTAAAAALVLGATAWPQSEAQASTKAVVEIMGKPMPEGPADLGHARYLAEQFLRAPFTLRFGQHSITASRAEWGTRVDVQHLTRLLLDAHSPQSAMRRLHGTRKMGRPLRLPMPTTTTSQLALPWIRRLKDRVDLAPVEARIEPRLRSVRPAKPGQDLRVVATLAALARAIRLGHNSAVAVVRSVEPKHDRRRYADLDMGAELSTFTTSYNRANTAADRTHNLKVTAAKIDGVVVEPGATFDFNHIVGPRSRANGYRAATVIAGGQLVEGMGGGTCQIASTLHAAALFAGLPIVERSPHSRPSYYIKLGLDATVAYGTLNFRFRNDLPFPVVIDATVEGGKARVALLGARRTRKVTFVREIRRALAFKETFDGDDGLPSGLRVLAQRGVPGFELSRTTTVEDVETNERREDRQVDVYPPTTQRWRIGHGPEAEEGFVTPDNDGHPEYVADEYLKAVADPAKQGIAVRSKQGRFGAYGWTLREGMGPTRPVSQP